jgi:hypothetical protein
VLEAVNARTAAAFAERRVRIDAWAAAHRVGQHAPKACAPIGPLASMDAFRCMVGPRLLPCRHHYAKADKPSPSYDQWSEM